MEEDDEVEVAVEDFQGPQGVRRKDVRRGRAVLDEADEERAREQFAAMPPSILYTVLYYICFAIGFPIYIFSSWVSVEPNVHFVVLMFGRVSRVLTESGLYFIPLFGREMIPISMRKQTFEITRNTVADANGNPVIISGVVTFLFTSALKAVLNVEDPNGYVEKQAQAVMKQICSRYPYESTDPAIPSLKTETHHISLEMVRTLQEKVACVGVEIISFEIGDLQYSPEIAQQMLMRQSAQALLDARRVIVRGATEIVTHSVEKLAQANVAMTEGEKARLVSTLIAVVCGDSRVTPSGGAAQSQQSSDIEELVNQSKTTGKKIDRLCASVEGLTQTLTATRAGGR